ncbi:MAG: thioredoxin family protein [Chloroherpetonaceae bacterium]|nr:thioredoxin family protein [Chloroherpetonaceae bacterium]MCS7212594.1 thioredoxin family protein [Chloroherpetonaceae bacterium]MDW8018620.1 thioredoxin family protein [Chloroherpetonaceae bacterium]MDW8467384.1 thioredoxin family protein [Chloroherpetonaceae bacterium]
MKHIFKFFSAAALWGLMASLLWAQPSGLQPGAVVPNFTLPTIDGELYSLYAQKGKKGFVVVFISTQCPVSNAYNARYIKLAEMAKQSLIEWIAINPNETEPLDEVRLHAREKGFPFPVLKDEGNRVTDLFGAKYTPEVFLLDANFRLLYRGRIDDNQREERVVSKDLEEAIAAYLAGLRVPNPVTTARGCLIKRSS